MTIIMVPMIGADEQQHGDDDRAEIMIMIGISGTSSSTSTQEHHQHHQHQRVR